MNEPSEFAKNLVTSMLEAEISKDPENRNYYDPVWDDGTVFRMAHMLDAAMGEEQLNLRAIDRIIRWATDQAQSLRLLAEKEAAKGSEFAEMRAVAAEALFRDCLEATAAFGQVRMRLLNPELWQRIQERIAESA